MPDITYKTASPGPVIGTHTGPGAIGKGTILIADY